MSEQEKKSKLTYYKKNPYKCPVCGTDTLQEELLTGRGRLIAGGLSLELRRYYKPSSQWGLARPLIYPISVCPKCLYSVFSADFEQKITNKERFKDFVVDSKNRLSLVQTHFPDSSFQKPNRDLVEGIVSYLLAHHCYSLHDPEYNPTFQSGKCAIRCAWLLQDFMNELTDADQRKKYQTLQDYYYREAAQKYGLTLEYEEKGIEPLPNHINLGPDTDKNFGFEGVKYLYCLLNYRMCFFEANITRRLMKFRMARKMLSQVFGFGVSSKEKPTPILNMAKLVHKLITDKILEYEQKIIHNETDFEDTIEINIIPEESLDEDLLYDYIRNQG